MSLEEKASCWAHLLLEFGYAIGELDITDTDFDDSAFLEAKKKKYIREYKNKT